MCRCVDVQMSVCVCVCVRACVRVFRQFTILNSTEYGSKIIRDETTDEKHSMTPHMYIIRT